MDIATFYALFSATCFTLLGLWWNVVQAYPDWVDDPRKRRAVGGVYLVFLLPAVMGLFAQVGGVTAPGVWHLSFFVVAVVGCWAVGRLLATMRSERDPHSPRKYVAALVVFVLVGLVAALPGAAVTVTGLRPLQTEAFLLSLLVLVGHGLVWDFMVSARSAAR
jgi:hypothetical protein